MIPTLSRAAATQLLIIRTALLSGLLLFGAATWYVKSHDNVATLTPQNARLYGYVFCALAASALLGLFVLRARLGAMSDTKQLASLYLVGYALAEGAALFGGVVWYLGGPSNWYIAGLVLMVVAFQMLPVSRPR